jgi:hypothetical protein
MCHRHSSQTKPRSLGGKCEDTSLSILPLSSDCMCRCKPGVQWSWAQFMEPGENQPPHCCYQMLLTFCPKPIRFNRSVAPLFCTQQNAVCVLIAQVAGHDQIRTGHVSCAPQLLPCISFAALQTLTLFAQDTPRTPSLATISTYGALL